MAGAPKENKNAEIWTIKEATKLFDDAILLSFDKDYDFIGEVARELKTYREIFVYLSDKFTELKPLYNRILSNLEANCFSHSKKGDIKEATAIVNLKSNYGWTDRLDNTSKGKEIIPKQNDLSKLTEQELRAYAELQSKLERD